MGRLLILVATLVLCATRAEACSVVAGYKIPTNFELVRDASVIVLGRVKDVAPMDEKASPFEHPSVTLEPIRFLKGTAQAGQLRLIGWRAPGNMSGVTTATTLSQSHWSAGIGGCIRQFYTPGEMVVAMFKHDAEAKKQTGLDLVQLFEPFARAVETVDDPEDVWVHAVDRYVSLQASPDVSGRIKQEIVKLHASSGAEAQAIAADLQYHLTRTDPENVWSTFAGPTSTNSGVIGQRSASLYCLAGTQPGVMVRGDPPSKLEVRTGSTALALNRVTPSAVEKLIVDRSSDDRRTLFHFTDSKLALSKLSSSSEIVVIAADAKTVASGKPLDALIRWARQCEKLQAQPAPTESELRRPAL